MIWENEYVRVEEEKSTIPWIKIFAKEECKELTECSDETRTALLKSMSICEKNMIEFYQPNKINIASFGNYVPQVHIHIQARFQTDPWFPEPTWGKKQRETNESFKLDWSGFKAILIKNLST